MVLFSAIKKETGKVLALESPRMGRTMCSITPLQNGIMGMTATLISKEESAEDRGKMASAHEQEVEC